jgi:hypothetical protein
MGSASSVASAQSNINNLHGDIGVLYKQINDRARWIINEINSRGYANKDAICSKILWTNYDELLTFFPVVTLNNVRYKAGVGITNPALEQNKISTCMEIERLYVKKINLINNIIQKLPRCFQMENKVYIGLEQRLNAEKLASPQANTERWLAIYQELESFNKDIKNRYTLISKQLENIRLAKTSAQIDGVARTTIGILNDTNGICETYENRLLEVSSALPKTKPQTVEVVKSEVLTAPLLETDAPVLE